MRATVDRLGVAIPVEQIGNDRRIPPGEAPRCPHHRRSSPRLRWPRWPGRRVPAARDPPAGSRDAPTVPASSILVAGGQDLAQRGQHPLIFRPVRGLLGTDNVA